jgi:hypothetical protein
MKQRAVEEFILIHGHDPVYNALLDSYPEAMVDATTQAKFHILELPIDIQTIILRPCWRDTRYIALVCKPWAHIVATRQDYWKTSIVEGLFIPPAVPVRFANYLRQQWHPFELNPAQGRATQLRWLFDGSQIEWGQNKLNHFYLLIKRWTDYVYWVDLTDESDSKELLIQVRHVAGKKGKIIENGAMVTRKIVAGHATGMYIERPYNSVAIRHLEWQKDGLKWSGAGLLCAEQALPHGDGCWTDAITGEVLLQGKAVAFAGKMHNETDYFAGKKRKLE